MRSARACTVTGRTGDWGVTPRSGTDCGAMALVTTRQGSQGTPPAELPAAEPTRNCGRAALALLAEVGPAHGS
jgi:hypothetical protein